METASLQAVFLTPCLQLSKGLTQLAYNLKIDYNTYI